MTTAHPAPHRLGLLHVAATFAAVLMFLFIVFWASAAFGALPEQIRAWLGPSVVSLPLLAIGLAYALVVGALTGLAAAFFFNALAFLHPKNGSVSPPAGSSNGTGAS